MRIISIDPIAQSDPVVCYVCELDKAETVARFRDSRAVGWFHMRDEKLPVNLPLCRFHAAQAGAGTLDVSFWTKPRK